MSNLGLLSILRDLEVELQQPGVRGHANRLQELLHPDFVEIGRSGRLFTRRSIIEDLTRETPGDSAHSQDFELREIADGLVLLTYRSIRISPQGVATDYARRSSLWQKTEAGWQVRFHQGTPTEAFRLREFS